MPDGEGDSQHRLQRKRRRLVLSCTECHRRKQKCDRLQPCTSCVSRGKEARCTYNEGDDDPANADDTVLQQPQPLPAGNLSGNDPAPKERQRSEQLGSEINGLGYSSEHAFSTLGLIRQLEDVEKPTVAAESQSERLLSHKLSSQYMSCIRQLPQRSQVDDIVRTFISDVAWHYDVVEEAMFMEQLRLWRSISHSTFVEGLHRLPPNLRYFPALLFQVLAQGLLFQPTGVDANHNLEQLKYAPGMTLCDVAAEYSQAGNTILSLLGKREATLVKVQAGILRASFLKSYGEVIEAWHALGTTIRDAQEIGLQSATPPTMPSALDKITKADGIWFMEQRKKLWMVLHLWDAHMAVVLGRPMATTELTAEQLPQECLVNESVPTAFGLIVLGYHTAYKYLPKIHMLQSTRQDFKTVEQIHKSIYGAIADSPGWCRAENPAADFDHLPWLPAARLALVTEVYYAVLALHRTQIFFSAKSRTEALKSALHILEAQACLFEASKTRHHLSFTFIFSTFDAIVLTLTVFLKFPMENSALLDSCLYHIELTLDRFQKIGERSEMARSAHGAILSLYNSLKKIFSKPTELTEDWIVSTSNPSTTHSSTEEHLIASWCDSDNFTPPHPFPEMLFDDSQSAELFFGDLSDPMTSDLFNVDPAPYNFQSSLPLVESGF